MRFLLHRKQLPDVAKVTALDNRELTQIPLLLLSLLCQNVTFVSMFSLDFS